MKRALFCNLLTRTYVFDVKISSAVCVQEALTFSSAQKTDSDAV